MSFDTTIDLGEIGEQDITVAFDYTRGWPGSFNEPPEPEEILDASVYLQRIISRMEQT